MVLEVRQAINAIRATDSFIKARSKLKKLSKRERKPAYAARTLADIDQWYAGEAEGAEAAE